MKINKTEFLKTLEYVKPGLAAKEIMEQSTSFIFQTGQVITYNDEVAVHASITEGFDVQGAVPAKELLGILSRFKGEEVEVEDKGDKLQLRCGRSRVGIRLEADVVLPVDQLRLPSDWQKLPADFAEGLSFVVPSAARNLYDDVFSAVHLTNVALEGSDNIRATRWELERLNWLRDDVLVQARTCTDLIKFDPVEFAEADRWAHFRNEQGAVFSCRTSAGKYPDVGELLNMKSVGTLYFPDQMDVMLDCASVFLDESFEQDAAVSINIDANGMMTVRGEGAYGEYEEPRRVRWDGGEITFRIHPNHLKSILKSSTRAEIGERVIKFSTDKFQHVVGLEIVNKKQDDDDDVPF